MPAEQPSMQEPLDRYDYWKRVAFLGSLLLAIIIMALSWWITPADDRFVARTYPPFVLIFSIMFVLMLSSRFPQQTMEGVTYLLMAAFILARLAWHYHAPGSLDDRLLLLAGGHYWAVGVIIVASFIAFERYSGLLAGALILVIALLIALSGIALELRDGGVSAQVISYLARIHLFLLALLLATAIMTLAREQHRRTQIRAEILDRWANTDSLTGVANRRAADRMLRTRLTEAERYDRKLSVILLDVDHFKTINDRQGHACGDAVLQGLARRLETCLRETDCLARWGGEEFLIIMPEIDARAAAEVAIRCQAALSATEIEDQTISATFGVAGFQSGDSIEALVGRADRALYAGKKDGRNRVLIDGETTAYA